MQIDKHMVVSLQYELRTEGFDSPLVEKTDNDHPLEFIYGMGMMIPKFEENLKGLKSNDTFKFKIDAAEGYGLSDEKNIIELPKTVFEVDGQMKEDLFVVGKVIPMQDNNGHMFNGSVKELKQDSIIMDFNHPMADKDLYFTGIIQTIRKATPEELDHGHVHGHGHHHH